MKLIGNYLSPYVRRVAISLNVIGLPYELEHVLVFKAPDEEPTSGSGAKDAAEA